MNFKKLSKSWNSLIDESKHQKRMGLGLIAIIILLIAVLMSREQIVIIQPETLTESATIGKNSASSEYQEAWALFFSQLLGNVTPSNVVFIKDKLAVYLHPKIYHEVMDTLEVQAEQIKQDRVTMRFEPRTIEYEEETGKMFVFGRTFVQGVRGKDIREDRTYEFIIKMSNYLPTLNYMDTYSGSARTTKLLKKLAAKESR